MQCGRTVLSKHATIKKKSDIAISWRMYSTQKKMLRETFELMLALIHVPRMHNKIYDSKIPYTTKYFENENIFYIGNNKGGNKTSNPLSN